MGEVHQALVAFVLRGAGEGINRLGEPAELADQQGPLSIRSSIATIRRIEGTVR
jgi:hypothetical protein